MQGVTMFTDKYPITGAFEMLPPMMNVTTALPVVPALVPPTNHLQRFNYPLQHALPESDLVVQTHTGKLRPLIQGATDNLPYAIFVDYPNDIINFGSTNTPGADFMSAYRTAPDDNADWRAVKFWMNGHQTVDAADFFIGMEVSVKYDVDAGKTNSSTVFGMRVRNGLYATPCQGTVAQIEGIQSYVGIFAGANAPTITKCIAVDAIADCTDGTIDDLYHYRAQQFNTGGTVTRSWGLYLDPFIGTENIGVYAIAGLKEVWRFKDLAQITGNQTDYDIGSGKNYNFDTNGAYNIDGFVAGPAQRDGAHVELYNPTAYVLTVIDSGGGGSATSGNKVFPTVGGNVAVNPGEMLEMKYNHVCDSGAGGWIAWVK